MSTLVGRRARIVELLQHDGALSVTELGKRLDVSEMTIRRDLVELEGQGILRRFHGGAMLFLGRSNEPPFLLRDAHAVAAKRRIAERVAQLIPDGESVALGYGTTVIALARQLADRENLTIVTPSLRSAQALANSTSLRVILTGGLLRTGEQSLWGREAERTFERHFADTAVIGAAGVDPSFGVTEYHFEEVAVVQAMARSAKRLIVAVDGSKLGVLAFAHVLPVTDIETVVTSDDADPEIVRGLTDRGVSVLVV